jgi:hypothetical protein
MAAVVGGVQWRQQLFDGVGDGLRIGDVEAKMAIDTSGGRWRQRASAFDGDDGRRWLLVFDGCVGRLLWQQWTIDMTFNGDSGGGIRW